MSLTGFDHVNIRTTQRDATLRFWRDVLGLAEGPRPGLNFQGAWLYCGDLPVIHLNFSSENEDADRTGAIDHVAFRVADRASILRTLQENDVSLFGQQTDESGNLRRALVRDPNGITVELLFQ
jgi:catechol 2,3-dioxygenase-like lactoylglutathione lyase family enzyme